MRLRSRRGDLLLSSLTAPAGTSPTTRPVRRRRLHWWIRTGALLSIIGIRRLARLARARRRPVLLGIGALVLVIGLMTGSSVAFVLGLLVVGSAGSDTGSRSPTAAMIRTWASLHKSRAGNPQPVIFSKELRDDVLAGEITVSFRLWKRPKVKTGGRYPVGPGAGLIEVDSVELIPFAHITDADVRRAGEPDREALRRRAAHAGPIDDGTLLYRVEFHPCG